MRRTTLAAMFLTSCVAGSSCAPAPARLIPSLDGKSDFAQRVVDQGSLTWDAEATGAFVADLEYHSYSFEAVAGGVIKLEVTQRGSSRDLDTVLLLYGPASADGRRKRLAVDFDSGWGGLSRIQDVELARDGQYTVLVGTASGLGRGRYRLMLGCAEGRCASSDAQLKLVEGEPNTEFMETLNMWHHDDCAAAGRAFSYDQSIDPTLAAVGKAVVEFMKKEYGFSGPEISYRGEATYADLDEHLRFMGLDRTAFEGLVGNLDQTSYRVAKVAYAYSCAPSVTCSGVIMVALVAEWHEVWTVDIMCGDE